MCWQIYTAWGLIYIQRVNIKIWVGCLAWFIPDKQMERFGLCSLYHQGKGRGTPPQTQHERSLNPPQVFTSSRTQPKKLPSDLFLSKKWNNFSFLGNQVKFSLEQVYSQMTCAHSSSCNRSLGWRVIPGKPRTEHQHLKSHPEQNTSSWNLTQHQHLKSYPEQNTNSWNLTQSRTAAPEIHPELMRWGNAALTCSLQLL